MDAPAVLSAREGLLEQLGLSKAGYRLNLVAYCKTTHEKANESQQRKKALVEARSTYQSLLLQFKFCHICKTDNPALVVRQVGTEAVVTTTCSNPKCQLQVYTWHSQPTMPGTGIPAANFLLCMAILLAGGSASKVFQTFSHMGLGCVSLNTFFKYQRSKLFPTIYMYWKKYQSKLLEKVKAVSGGVVVAGDGGHDSMGHSEKFGAYTIFCCTVPMIIHFALIQHVKSMSVVSLLHLIIKSLPKKYLHNGGQWKWGDQECWLDSTGKQVVLQVGISLIISMSFVRLRLE
ncbi:uncharacterized protein LOC122963247 [Acropora millepora]|uniref:uncharacterized protein LOC122963247 n=1 Tax=Acropora millepora TaxID=45264 RepID=UPI001CF3E100|nr:uncharacterized protein LOC122963247 [Acropora millepora]